MGGLPCVGRLVRGHVENLHLPVVVGPTSYVACHICSFWELRRCSWFLELTHLRILASSRALLRSSRLRQWRLSLDWGAASSLGADFAEDVEEGSSSVMVGGHSRVGGDWSGVSVVSWKSEPVSSMSQGYVSIAMISKARLRGLWPKRYCICKWLGLASTRSGHTPYRHQLCPKVKLTFRTSSVGTEEAY